MNYTSSSFYWDRGAPPGAGASDPQEWQIVQFKHAWNVSTSIIEKGKIRV